MAALLLAIIYLIAIGVGLPNPLLGAAWPSMHTEMGVPVSWSGGIFMIISLGTVVASLISDRMMKRFGAGKFAAGGILLSALAVFGFSFSHSYAVLCLLAVPYGIGIGSADAAANNYVVHHYPSRYTSWMHCIWGVGATAGTYIMSKALEVSNNWNTGYRWIGFCLVGITALLIMSLPLWKKNDSIDTEGAEMKKSAALSLREIIELPGAKAAMLCCFCYCALEQTVSLWASSFLVSSKGLDPSTAAKFASLFFLGITAGRGVSGFVSFRLSDRQMVMLGQGIIALGILSIILPLGNMAAFVGLITVGVGCAPIYPSLLHSAPSYFGEDRSKAVVGVQMASAYMGTSLMPPLFGLIGGQVSLKIFPYFLLVALIGMMIAHGLMNRRALTQA